MASHKPSEWSGWLKTPPVSSVVVFRDCDSLSPSLRMDVRLRFSFPFSFLLLFFTLVSRFLLYGNGIGGRGAF